tara:strand:- start:1142 stop:2065 length:924 start_codon:yes stop_codon:yes gene_type:complete
MNKKAKNSVNRKKDDDRSVLEVFIDAHIKSYNPPERKGKKRGEAIGIPLHKYKASLLYLTVDGQKGIAKGAKVSYGLLRKWMTEQKFRNLIKEHKEEFRGFFLREFDHKLRESRYLLNESLNSPAEEIELCTIPSPESAIPKRFFRDMAKYNNELLLSIFDHIYFQVKNESKDFCSGYLDFLEKGRSLRKIIENVLEADIVKIIALLIEAEAVFRRIVASLELSEKERMKYIFDDMPNLKIQDDLTNINDIDQDTKEKAMEINLERQKINALMVQIAGALLKNHKQLNKKQRKLVNFLIRRFAFTTW